ncbi:PAS domain-containing sensor histidine kinase [Hyalangium gracile]|uniref:PAS domain-containing sensor histidine kinase n=1 Tax=Hyalangium gracile TaxID=394092 RepID=UPI001CC96508|nr:ATP-binding protein [Hyalangium gracile]
MAPLGTHPSDELSGRQASRSAGGAQARQEGIDTVLFDQMEESVSVFRCDGTYLYLNAATERMFGKSREEVLGRCVWDVYPGVEGGAFHRAFIQVRETGAGLEYEHLYEPWGRWYRQRIYRSGDRLYVFSRETTEEHLRADAFLLHARILENMTEGVSLTNESGVIVYTNPAEDQIFGYGSGELLGQHVSVQNAAPPEESRRFVEEVIDRLRREGSWEGEIENRRKDGTAFTTAARISALHIGGKPHWLCVQKDITEQKRADAERAESYEFTERLYEQTRLAEQRATFLALASEVLASSLDREEILRSLTRLAVPTLGDWCAVDEATSDGKVRRVSAVHLQPERLAQGEAFHARYPILLDDAGGIGKVLRMGTTEYVLDLSDELLERTIPDPEMRRATRELGIKSLISVPLRSRGRTLAALTLCYADSGRRYTEADVRLAEDLARRAATSLDNGLLYKEAQDAVRARDSFLSIASHELNTPLTSLSLNVQALHRAFQKAATGADGLAQETVGVKLHAVQRQISRLAKLIHELLDVSRITSGKLRLEPEEVELTTLARELVPRFADDLTRAECELRLSAPESAVVGHWDRLRVEQILQNLLSNAIKYGHGLPIELELTADAQWARVVVRDQGIGISAEDQARLFQRFERLASERHYSGFGLGLWIVRQILDAMGGRIHVRSEPGKGSVFTVELPRRPPGSPPPAGS